VNSHTTERFREALKELPKEVQEQAREAYRLWEQNPQHPSLHFKRIHATKPVYSVRVALAWRAVGVRSGDAMVWFWIGSHADYETLISRL
jgi:hypothetical protein